MFKNVSVLLYSAILICYSVNAAACEPSDQGALEDNSVLEYVDTAFGLDKQTRAYLHSLYDEAEVDQEWHHLRRMQSHFPHFTDELEANRAELRAYCGGAFDFADIPDLGNSFVGKATLEEVQDYATLCQNIYNIKKQGDPQRLMLVNRFKDYRLLYVLSRNKGAQISGAVLYDKQARHVVIVFAGANSGVDWAWNTLGCKSTTWYPTLTVHTGAAYQAHLQRAQVYEALDALEADRPLRVTVTGHGLGGAISTLIALDIKTRMSEATVENITFGSLRTFGIGSSFQVESFLGLGQILRVANERDPVTMHPHPNVFRHVGVPVPLQSHRDRFDYIPAGAAFGATVGFLRGLHKGPLSATQRAVKSGSRWVGAYHAMQAYLDTLPRQYLAFRELVERRVELLHRVEKAELKVEDFFPQAFERVQRAKEARRALQAQLNPDRTRARLRAELDRVTNYQAGFHAPNLEAYARLLLVAITSLHD